MSFGKKFVNSARELKSVYAITALGMLLALRIIVGIFANATMPMFGNMLKISINFLPIAVAACMFGPICGGIVGAMGDILSIMIYNPSGTEYFPGFTLNGFLTGVIFGIFLYKNNSKILNVILAWFVNTLLVEVLMSGYWLYFIYGAGSDKTFWVFLWTRIISEAIKAVPTILIMLSFCKISGKIPVPSKIRS